MLSMTEEEARKKWCPFARTGAFTDQDQMMAVTVNRDPRDEVMDGCRCIASECMAWRWHGYAGEEIALDRDHPFRKFPRDEHDQRYGYCGLAGRP